MSRGDKYRKAHGLSKIFEEMLARNSGDKARAAKAMDDELGEAWRLEIVIDDEVGPEFIEPAILELEVADEVPESERMEVDDMFKKARKFSETFIRPGDDMENDPKLHVNKSDTEDMCISDLLRKLADHLDKKK